MTGYGEGLLDLFYRVLHKAGVGTEDLKANKRLRDELLALRDDGMIQSVRIGDSWSWSLTQQGIWMAEHGREIQSARIDRSLSDTLEMIKNPQ